MASKAFLKIESADPKQFQGESQDKDHRNWIDILSLSIEITAAKHAGDEKTTKPKSGRQEIKFQKSSDPSSSDLIQAIASGTELKRVLLHAVSTREDGGKHNVRWEFHDAKLVNFRRVAWRGDGADGFGSAKHASQKEGQDIDSFSIAYKSVSHQVGAPLPGSSQSDRWSTAGGGASASNGSVSVGAMALAMHMLRLHQVG